MQPREVVVIASRLARKLGPEGAREVARRAEDHALEGRPEDARFWREVAKVMADLAGRSEASGVATAPHSWIEDRVQTYVGRAMQAERKAVIGSDEFRREMLDIAMQWRDLARTMRLMSFER